MRIFSDFDGFSVSTFGGAVEFGVTNKFSVAADLILHSFENTDETLTGVTLHGIYSVNPDLHAGLFLSRETFFNMGSDSYGVEVAYTSGPMDFEGYLGASDDNGTDNTRLGLAGAYEFSNGFSVIGSYDKIKYTEFTSQSISSMEAGVGYALGNGAEFSASVGQLHYEAFGFTLAKEPYLSIAATFNFGPQGGTTFKHRGFFELGPVTGGD